MSGVRLKVKGTATIREDFDPKEFALPLEEFSDGRLSHYEVTLQKKQQKRIDMARLRLRHENIVGNNLNKEYKEMNERIYRDGTSKILNVGKSINLGSEPSLVGTRMKRLQGEARSELDFVRSIVGYDHLALKDLSKKTLKDFEDESTLDFPRLNTIEEKMEDLRQEGYEHFHHKRGRKMAARFPNKDKRMLRKWFQELDFDGSGEVSVMELQDPMLSAGIFKTREQIFRVMLNADKNDTMGLDFEEFLNALYNSKNELIDTRKLKQLQDMGNDRNGIQMETLITAERRKKILNSIVNQMEKRTEDFETAHGRCKRSARKVETEKRRIREEEEAAASRPPSQARSGLVTPVSAQSGDGPRVLSAAARARATRNNPIFREHARNTRDLKLLEVRQNEDKKLYDSYLDSLEVVLKQKRDMEDKKLEERINKIRLSTQKSGKLFKAFATGDKDVLEHYGADEDDTARAGAAEANGINYDKDRSNRYKAYTRSPKKPSMFGNARRAYQLSVDQADGKTFLDILDNID